jgi:hypothetical protein
MRSSGRKHLITLSMTSNVIEHLDRNEIGPYRGELVFDRARPFLVDLGGEQSPSDVLRFMLALDGRGHDLIEGGLHAVELTFANLEELGSFHQMVLLRLS